MAELEYFPWYNSYCKRLAKLSDQEVGRLVRALARYSETGEQQELTGRESVAFDFIAVDIDRAKEAYAKKCESNRKNRQRPSTTDDGRQRTSTNTKGNTKKEIPPDGGIKKDAAAVVDAFLDKINAAPSENTLRELERYAQTMGADCCLRAFDIALDEKKTGWSYIRAILKAKQEQGVRCLADWDRLEEKRAANGRTAQNGGYPDDYWS